MLRCAAPKPSAHGFFQRSAATWRATNACGPNTAA